MSISITIHVPVRILTVCLFGRVFLGSPTYLMTDTCKVPVGGRDSYDARLIFLSYTVPSLENSLVILNHEQATYCIEGPFSSFVFSQRRYNNTHQTSSKS